MRLSLQVLNNMGDVIAEARNDGNGDIPVELVFTSQDDNEYTLRIAPWLGVSEYELIVRKQ